MEPTHRKVQVLGDSETMSIWVGSGSDPGNTRLDLSIPEWDDLVEYFMSRFGISE